MFPPFSGPRYLAHGEKPPGNNHDQATPPSSRAGRRNSLNNNPKLIQAGFFKDAPSLGDYKQHNFKYLPRTLIVPALHVRKARVEDCDDLVPMFKKYKVSCAWTDMISSETDNLDNEDAR